MFASDVLSTLPKPTIVLSIPDTVPVNVGLARGAFASNAVCVAAETGLFASDVLSTFPKPTIVWVMPPTVPVKVGLLIGAFAANLFIKFKEFVSVFAEYKAYGTLISSCVPRVT